MTRSHDPHASELLDRLRAGDTPAQAGKGLNLTPHQVVEALVSTTLKPVDPACWPGLAQSRAPRPWLAPALGEEAWAEAFPRATRPACLALAAGLLQIHDFWNASHEAAQQADDLGERGYSAYWHGIAHRREPDASNAAYWFRRVGRHPIFGPLAETARLLLDQHGDAALTGSLLGDGSWNPFMFVDLCTSARPGSPRAELALRLQRLEMLLLLDATLKGLS
jgi:hypothetical protein